LRSGSCGV
jgi:GTPase